MSDKSRKTAFIVTTVVMAVFTVLAAAAFCRVVTVRLFDPNELSDFRVDGTDFTPLIKIGASITSTLARAVAVSALIAASIIGTLAVWGIFRLCAFKNASAVGKDELIFSCKFFIISSAAVLAIVLACAVVSAILIGSGAPLWSLVFCLFNSLFMLLFYIRKLYRSAA